MDNGNNTIFDNGNLEHKAEQWSHSEKPNERFLSAIAGVNLPMLLNDDVWLVRHGALRTAEQKRLLKDEWQPCVETANPKYVDISVIAYTLYKYNPTGDVELPKKLKDDLHFWCDHIKFCWESGEVPLNYNDWRKSFGDEIIPEHSNIKTYYEFCGFNQAGNIGIYHDRDFIVSLFEHDWTLSALYDYDITGEASPYLEDKLTDAKERCRDVDLKNSAYVKDDINIP